MAERRWGGVGALAALVLLLASAGAAGSTPEEEAARVVESLHAALLENMREGERLSFAERVLRLEPVVAGAFDFETITKIALGRAFPDLDAAHRARFRDLIERLSVATYAANFKRLANEERFVVATREAARGGRVVVRARLERNDGEPISLDYVLQPDGDGLRIVNVLANGVSDLSLKRAQYAAVIRDHGVDELARRIERQLRNLVEESDSSG